MQKIPVGATIAHAYRFVFRDFGTLLRAVWLPLLAQLVVLYFMFRRAGLFLAAAAARDPSATALFGPVLLLTILTIILLGVLFTAATEAALGLAPQGPAYFPLGKKMWRLLGGLLSGAILSMLGLMLVFVVIGFLAAFLAALSKAATPSAIGTAAIRVAALGGYLVFLFLMVRFLFLLAPANVTEQRVALGRAWQLSRSNFWRLFLVTMAIMIPVVIAQYALALTMSGLPPDIRGLSKEAAKAVEMAWRASEMQSFAAKWYITLPASGLIMLFQFGAGAAAQAFAYRWLTQGSAPVASDALPD